MEIVLNKWIAKKRKILYPYKFQKRGSGKTLLMPFSSVIYICTRSKSKLVAGQKLIGACVFTQGLTELIVGTF